MLYPDLIHYEAVPFEPGGVQAFLPVRLVVMERIVNQTGVGFPYRIPSYRLSQLDDVLNGSLKEDFRAATPRQLQFASQIAEVLDLTPARDQMASSAGIGMFIARHLEAYRARLR